MDNLVNAVNAFLNEVDSMGIASTVFDEYDLEADAIIDNFDSSMCVDDVSDLYTSCFEHYFSVTCKLTTEESNKLYEILKSQ